MASPSQTNLEFAIVPFQELPYYVYTSEVLYIDDLGISYNASPTQEINSTIGGEHSKSTPLTDDNAPIAHFIPKHLRSCLRKIIRKHAAHFMKENTDDVQSTPSEVFSVWMTRLVKRTLEEQFILLSAKKPRISKSKSYSQTETIDIPDDPSEYEKTKKGKNKVSSNAHKKQVRKVKSGNDGVQANMGEGKVFENIDDNLDSHTKRILNFTRRSMIRGRVITGFGGAEMRELLSILHAQGWTDLFPQGNTRRKMGKDETRQFYINATRSPSSISSVVRGEHINLTPDIVAQMLGVPNTRWCRYVKRIWPPLDGLPSALDIVHKFLNDPTVEDYSRVDKGAMLPLHRLLFDVVHKIILPRKQKRTEANYLDLTLMELLLSRHPINLPQLMLFHIHSICVEDNKLHALGYGFWLGEIFEYLKVPIKVWEVQTTKDVLGTVNHADVPAPWRGENAHMQRLRAQLTLKDEEITALRVSHNAAMDQLHVSYGLEHARLVEENAKLKEDLAKS
ncbi:hypothetical protein KY290_033422 [Solanum tuberosum]|uniref:Putative plant transposon protein domain-containing protein n=1 Tax=Solanum tuberosum TaxID=4113 RepID=A0ABQ7U087_SOLTU|nr:hypothetical protein KY289_032782 [Solanum tuberosum]KAH0647424.1 hypothetical protein KY285_032672 [Solanum tuberosum]KAH0740379.1 hypothetical protein KY290_033422 [Solanum tuberosum]